MAETDTKAPAKAKPAALRKGALVKVNRAAYNASLEAAASDPTAPDYIFEGPGMYTYARTMFIASSTICSRVACPTDRSAQDHANMCVRNVCVSAGAQNGPKQAKTDQLTGQNGPKQAKMVQNRPK